MNNREVWKSPDNYEAALKNDEQMFQMVDDKQQ